MIATERNYGDKLMRLIVAFVLLSASLAAWSDMALTREYDYDLESPGARGEALTAENTKATEYKKQGFLNDRKYHIRP